MKRLFGLLAAFCLLALPSTAFAFGAQSSISASTIERAFHATSDHAVTVHRAAITKTAFAGNPATARDMVSRSSPATIEARNVLASYSNSKTAKAPLRHCLDGDRNRSNTYLTIMVKERTRGLGLKANYFVPEPMRHQWRAGIDPRSPSSADLARLLS